MNKGWVQKPLWCLLLGLNLGSGVHSAMQDQVLAVLMYFGSAGLCWHHLVRLWQEDWE